MPTTILNEPNQLLLARTLNELIERDIKLTPAALARTLGIPTNKITRILNGDVTDPKASTLLQIANHFDITIEQLLGLEPIVRQGTHEKQEATRRVPVFEFSRLGQPKISKEWYRWVENDVEGDYYSLVIDTDLYEPTFLKNSLLIINPDINPDDRSYIVVKKNSSPVHYFIKKYVIDGNQAYFYPINPKLPIEIYDNNIYTITGVILEVHQKFYSKK